jgi:site-specific recombinase XerD
MRQHTEILASRSHSVNDYDTFQRLIPSFERNFRAINRAPKTIATYLEALRQFAGFVQGSGMPNYPALTTREHIEHFIVHLQDRGLSSATINNRSRGLQSFFKWMVEVEGEIRADPNPIARLKSPKVDETLPSFLELEGLQKLVEHCLKSEDQNARRDTAIIQVFIDTTARLSEIAEIKLGDVERDTGLITVTGKGDRTRRVCIGPKTGQAVDRYLRRRQQKFGRGTDRLWLGSGGGQQVNKKPYLGIFGIRNMMQKRAEDAGLDHINPHQLRHTAAHYAKIVDDYKDADIMAQFGWRSARSMDKYARGTAEEKAHGAHKRHSLGDRI